MNATQISLDKSKNLSQESDLALNELVLNESNRRLQNTLNKIQQLQLYAEKNITWIKGKCLNFLNITIEYVI